jgi:hypothetical protein
MSPRSIYLRDQAENLCWQLACPTLSVMPKRKGQLRKLIEAAGPFCFGLTRNSARKKFHKSQNILSLFLSVTGQDVDSSWPYPILARDIGERSMIGKQTIEEKWRQQSEVAKQQAKKLPCGK